MDHYRSQLLLSASPATVYHALATQQGLRNWWTETCDVASAVGGRATFRFNRIHKVMRIESLVPEREVRWHCIEAHIVAPGVAHPDEWVGTDINFRLSPPADGNTRLDFEHIGLTPAMECFEICQAGWNKCLGSLQSLVETGQGNPFVRDVSVCHA